MGDEGRSVVDFSEFGYDENGNPPEEDGSDAPDEYQMSEAEARRVVAQLENPDQVLPESEDDLADDNYMTEVDRRLEVATCYRQLLRSPLFDSKSPATTIVEREIRAFVKERLEVLVALRAEKSQPQPQVAPSPFTESEVLALKTLAAVALRREQSTPAQQPSVKPAQAPAVPQPAAVRTRPAPEAPVVAAKPAPQATRPQRQHSQKPQPKPPAKRGGRVPPVTLKKVVTDQNGEVHEIEVQRRQEPAGKVPFPADMSAGTMAAATSSVSAANKSPAVVGVINTLAAAGK